MIESAIPFTLTEVTAIATLCLVIVALVQLVLLRRSLVESAKARSASVLLSIYRMMHDLRPSWLQLYTYPDDFQCWNQEQRALADRVGTELQQISYLCLQGLVDQRYVRGNWAGTFTRCWNKLEGYVRDYRIQCGEPPDLKTGGLQRKHFELFAQSCKKMYRG